MRELHSKLIDLNVKQMKKKTIIVAIGVAIFLGLLPHLVLGQEKMVRPRRVYITLDVSSSMEGNKYIMANYTAQIISVFSDKHDEVVLYYFGEPHILDGKDNLKSIQVAFDMLGKKKQNTYNEISDITRFLSDYHPDPEKEDWLFIIGDGDWSIQKGSYDSKTEFDATWKKLKVFLKKNNIQVCYLQTGERLNDSFVFTDSLSRIVKPTIDIRKSDTTAVSVLENCIYFANRILGFSKESIIIKQEGEQCVSFKSELPLERFILFYQSRKGCEVKLESVEYNGIVLPSKAIVMKGSPSTAPLVGGKTSSLGGMVWEVNCTDPIPGNELTKVCFDRPVEAGSLVLYPYVDVLAGMQPFGWMMDTLKESAHNMFDACDTLTRLNVVITLTDRHGKKFPPPVMEKMSVHLIVETDSVVVDYKPSDTTFMAIVPMTEDKVSYFIMVDSPGYFSHSTIDDPQIVQKTIICKPDPEIVPIDTLPLHVFKSVKFKTLIEKGEFGGMVEDSLFGIIASLGTFGEQHVAEKEDYNYLGDVNFSYNGGQLIFSQVPNGSWCECWFTDTLFYWVTLRSTPGILHDDKVYEGFVIPVAVPIDMQPFAVRCWHQLIVAIILFVFILFIIALLKKNRFKKSARIENSYVDQENPKKEIHKNGRLLREPGFVPWFNRWFNPFIDERRSMSFTRPKTKSLTFVATSSKERVRLTASSIDERTMTFINSIPHPDAQKREDVVLSQGNQIEIKDSHGQKLGHLIFSTGNKNDEGGYRFLLIVILILGLVAECYLVITMLKSLL